MIEEVLRYWLAMIRHEEALSRRVKAAPPVARGVRFAPNLREPRPGRSYFRLRCGGPEGAEELLVRARSTVELPISGDRGEFFEHWLRRLYQAQRYRALDEGGGLGDMVAAFPVVYDRRRGELSTVLRLPLGEIRWLDAVGERWSVPGFDARRDRRITLTPPSSLALVADEPEEGELPFTLDEVVLGRVLGVQDEAVGELLRRLEAEPEETSAVSMIRRVIELLDPAAEVSSEASPLEMIARLVEAVRARALASATQVFPLGIVYDGSLGAMTHHLQRDLRRLIRRVEAIQSSKVLHSYLTGERLEGGQRTHLGCRAGVELTPSQRQVAERFAGSPLTVAQGPPGTGKTELILALAAGAVIDRASRASQGERPSVPAEPVFVVASTNNRAVDNVVEPLSEHLAAERLPVALRVGSRIAVVTSAIPTLHRSARWLQAARPDRQGYLDARRRLRDAVEAVRRADEPLDEARRVQRALDEAERRVDELRERLSEALKRPAEDQISTVQLDAARRAAVASRRALDRAFERVESTSRKRNARRATRPVDKTIQTRLLPALSAIGLEPAFSVDGAGDAPGEWLEEVDLWLEAQDAAIAGRADLAQEQPETLRPRLARAEDELARLEEQVCDPEPLDEARQRVVAERERGLFEVALEVREGWAALDRERLSSVVDAAAAALEANPSLASLARSRKGLFGDLMELFPVVGSTLLSMANSFPSSTGRKGGGALPEVIDRLVIDEAGQCHPAHAASALGRAKQALIIGDVHQLEPVIELGESDEARVLRRLGASLSLEELEPYRVYRFAEASAQKLAARAVAEVPALREHFRCQREIIEVSDRLCGYGLEVRTPPAGLGEVAPRLRRPLIGLPVRGAQAPLIGSWRNDAEVRRLVELVVELLRAGVRPEQIAALTPYRGQRRALEAALRAAQVPIDDPPEQPAGAQGQLYEDRAGSSLAVGTLHRFQGGERDVVILSTVVTRPRSLPFLNSRPNLINVAVSRARLHLVLIGEPRVLLEGPVTGELVRAIRGGNGGIVERKRPR